MVTCHRKTIALLIMILFVTQTIYSVAASLTSAVSFSSNGVTIVIEFPDEAHPLDNITHEISITSDASTTLSNFAVIIRAPVNSIWQEVYTGQDNLSKSLPVDYNLTLPPLPQNANGTLQCFIFVNTSSIDYISTTIYTTRVSELTFSEMQTLYDEILTNYTALFNEYNDLFGNYSGLLANYTSLLSNNAILQDKYDDQLAIYKSLQDSNNDLTNQFNTLNSNYQSKTADYNSLRTDYQTLNSTRNALQISYKDLQDAYNNLDQAYNELQAQEATQQSSENDVNNLIAVIIVLAIIIAALAILTIYIKQKSKEPYIVIHKESPIKNLDEDEEQNGTDTQ